jgi:hypothetical protein
MPYCVNTTLTCISYLVGDGGKGANTPALGGSAGREPRWLDLRHGVRGDVPRVGSDTARTVGVCGPAAVACERAKAGHRSRRRDEGPEAL